MEQRPKVFCIGYHKTGTTSLYAALKTLGYRVTGPVGEGWTAERFRAEGAELCVETMQRFDAAEDMPWPLFYRELDAAYPGSKFVLTVREPEAWFSSIANHFGDGDKPLHRLAYGDDKGIAIQHKDHWIRTMTAHNDAVKAHFEDRPEALLVMELAKGDGWDVLCPFLGAAVPEDAFPVKNSSAQRASLAYRIKLRLWRLFGVAARPERLV